MRNLFIVLQKAQRTFIRKKNLFIPFTIIIVAYFEVQIKLINMFCQYNTCGNYIMIFCGKHIKTALTSIHSSVCLRIVFCVSVDYKNK